MNSSNTKGVDVLAVIQVEETARRRNGNRERASGNLGKAGDFYQRAEQLQSVRTAIDKLMSEARKVEASIHALGMTCDEFSAALARCGSQP